MVAATVGKPSYAVGQHPRFGMTVVNISRKRCVADTANRQRELIVRAAGGARQWSSNDCSYAPDRPHRQTLRPSQQLHYGVTWAGRSSRPGCPVKRHRIPAGKYTLTARLGDVRSVPAPFTLTR